MGGSYPFVGLYSRAACKAGKVKFGILHHSLKLLKKFHTISNLSKCSTSTMISFAIGFLGKSLELVNRGTISMIESGMGNLILYLSTCSG